MTGPARDAAAMPSWPEHLRPGQPFELAPGVTRIIAPNPGMMTGPGTNTYLLGSDRLALIDPGPIDAEHRRRLLEEVGDRLAWILVTHTHIDHSPLAAELKRATGAETVAFGPAPAAASSPAGQGKTGRTATSLDAHDIDFVPDIVLLDGEHIDTGEMRLAAVYTPGHTSNHLCFEIEGTGILFSGDHVMSGSTVVIAPPDGDMAVYLESLRKVRDRKPRRIAPGHGDVIEDPAAVLDGYLRHRLEREQQVLAGLQAAPPVAGATTTDLVSAIYVDVPAQLHPVARFSVWAHLRKLMQDGKARTDEPDDIDAPWYGVTPHT